MAKIKSSARLWLLIALITSVSFVAAIPLIIISASGGIKWLLIVSIILAAHGFYGTPMYWMAFASKKELSNILALIEVQKLRSVKDISQQTGKDIEYLSEKIRYLISNGYLTGYIFDGEAIKKFVPENEGPKMTNGVCPSCGAPVTLSDGEGQCEYCGTVISK